MDVNRNVAQSLPSPQRGTRNPGVWEGKLDKVHTRRRHHVPLAMLEDTMEVESLG